MAQEQAAAYLVIQEGPQAGKRVEICKDHTTIGRSRECDIFLEDISVHRKQASLLWSPAGYVLRDDHGSGDSMVNGSPVTEELLKNGDQLHFGNTLLMYYSHDATRPFQLPSSRGRELHIDKQPETHARLELDSRRAFQSFELQAEVTIGRSRDCSIFLEDLAVSRLHATVRQLPDGGYELEDHRSATGTFVNGMRITCYRLLEGDVIQIGSSRLTFRH